MYLLILLRRACRDDYRVSPQRMATGTIQFDLTIREIANPANSATFSEEMTVASGLV